ncbi:DGQHR domain-containing protein [Azospirillum oryzae]|uniref:DGQHR domain-containing protein n=1 Tax=Azospirillum oryzae TaxID=286727 RepID=A0A1X7GQ20_9PROT|nr:DGQHR domain-containing protein [Azospirillum oryzae]SMF73055.1 DGQHR domain-containing protein [Azospirillum oryzae]
MVSLEKSVAYHSTSCLVTKFGEIPAYTFAIKAKDLLLLHYVAVRGRDDEEGAVQRPLNSRRILNIRNYVLDGNTFFNSFILNWTDKNYNPKISKGNISIPIKRAVAQVIDGQHRLTGLAQAISVREEIGEQDLLVTLCIGLSTPEAARIFLNINTEQKPVPKSLIFDLFGEVVDDETHVVNRATDLARDLNGDPESALYKLIKFPGSPRGQGNIELSTFVAAFKEHLKHPQGTFYNYKIRDYERQKLAIGNYFQAIRDYYSDQKLWDSAKNPFLKAAGFNGAVDFFIESLMKRCAEKGSFSVPTMKNLIRLDREGLITWDDLRGKDGKTARKLIRDLLESHILSSLPNHDEYEF